MNSIKIELLGSKTRCHSFPSFVIVWIFRNRDPFKFKDHWPDLPPSLLTLPRARCLFVVRLNRTVCRTRHRVRSWGRAAAWGHRADRRGRRRSGSCSNRPSAASAARPPSRVGRRRWPWSTRRGCPHSACSRRCTSGIWLWTCTTQRPPPGWVNFVPISTK